MEFPRGWKVDSPTHKLSSWYPEDKTPPPLNRFRSWGKLFQYKFYENQLMFTWCVVQTNGGTLFSAVDSIPLLPPLSVDISYLICDRKKAALLGKFSHPTRNGFCYCLGFRQESNIIRVEHIVLYNWLTYRNLILKIHEASRFKAFPPSGVLFKNSQAEEEKMVSIKSTLFGGTPRLCDQ